MTAGDRFCVGEKQQVLLEKKITAESEEQTLRYSNDQIVDKNIANNSIYCSNLNTTLLPKQDVWCYTSKQLLAQID